MQLSGERSAFDGLFRKKFQGVGFFNRFDQFDREDLVIAFHRRLPVPDLPSFDAGERVVRRQQDREFGKVPLNDIVTKLGDEFDDCGCDLRGSDCFAGDQCFTRGFSGPALPAQRDSAVGAQNTANL
jgi:hypothetical protein